jgi:hypothetical protein
MIALTGWNQTPFTSFTLVSLGAALQPHDGQIISETCLGIAGLSRAAAELMSVRVLQKNGWVQLTEWDDTFRSDSGDTDALQALHEWSRLYKSCLGQTNRPGGKKSTRITEDCEILLRMAGFTDVRVDVRDIPTCAWRTGMSADMVAHLWTKRANTTINKTNMVAALGKPTCAT